MKEKKAVHLSEAMGSDNPVLQHHNAEEWNCYYPPYFRNKYNKYSELKACFTNQNDRIIDQLWPTKMQ